MAAEGAEELRQLKASGQFSQEEIDNYKNEMSVTLQDGGFSTKEIDDFWGHKTPDEKDMAQLTQIFNSNIDKNIPSQEGQIEANSFLDYVEAGWDMSVSGLLVQRENPDVVLPENAPMYGRILSQISTLAGDAPAMIAGVLAGAPVGAVVGGAVGSAAPVVGTAVGAAAGTVVGAGAGAMALPEAMRKWIMEGYEKGSISSFSDFLERASATFLSGTKGAVIGGLTAGSGGAVAGTLAKRATEVAVMTNVSAALNGHGVEKEHILDAAVMVFGMHGAIVGAKKIANTYSKSGAPPAEIAIESQKNGKLRQGILAQNKPYPDAIETPSVKKSLLDTPPEIPVRAKEPFPGLAGPEFSASENVVLSRIGVKVETPGSKYGFNQFYTDFVDRNHPLNVVVKKLTENGNAPLLAEENPYILARTSVDANAKARHFIEFGTLDFKTMRQGGKDSSMWGAITSVEDPTKLQAVAVALNALDRIKQGKNPGIPEEAAKQVVAEAPKEYLSAAKRLTEYNNSVLKYARDSGLISEEFYVRAVKQNTSYVSFKRVLPKVEDAPSGGGKLGSLKEFKGSEYPIQNIFVSSMENTQEIVAAAEVNRARTKFVDIALKHEKETGISTIRKVPGRLVRARVDAKKLSKELDAMGFDISPEELVEIEAFSRIREPLKKNQFSIRRNGKTEIYEADPILAESLRALDNDPVAMPFLLKFASSITALKKVGITSTPEFLTKNFFRDLLSGKILTSSSAGLKFTDVIKGFMSRLTEDETFQKWLTSGGADGAFLDLSESWFNNKMRKLQKETNFLGSTKNLLLTGWDYAKLAASLSEQSVRIGEFIRTQKEGKSLVESGFAAREVTLDFARMGAKMRAFNLITSFSNAQLQGTDRIIRAAIKDPKKFFQNGFLWVTAPSILLWLANKDDERVKALPDWERDNNWIIATDDWQDADTLTQSNFGELGVSAKTYDDLPEYLKRIKNGKLQINTGSLHKLPKPLELGLFFGTMPERALDLFFQKNPRGLESFVSTVMDIVTPNFIPDVPLLGVELFTNKSFFTGGDIVPEYLQDVLPEFQYQEYTSETAKSIGALVGEVLPRGASPIEIEHLVRSWSGAFGQYAIEFMDKSLTAAGVLPETVKPTPVGADIPFIKAFTVRFSAGRSAPVQEFWDKYRNIKSRTDSLKLLQKQAEMGDTLAVEKYKKLSERVDVKNAMVVAGYLSDVKSALSGQSKFIRMINAHPRLTADEKRQQIDITYINMIEIAKEANKQIAVMEKMLQDNEERDEK